MEDGISKKDIQRIDGHPTWENIKNQTEYLIYFEKVEDIFK